METRLSREEIIELLKSTNPSQKMIIDPVIIKLGKWRGGIVNKWQWCYFHKNYDEFTDVELYDAYLKIKEDE